MAEVEIRPAVQTDLPVLEKFDHSCETTHAWQLVTNMQNDRYDIHLVEIRLPRTLHLKYPRQPDALKEHWKDHMLLLVARCGGELAGYLVLDDHAELDTAVVRDLVVKTIMRRQGVATALVLSAQDWVKRAGVAKMTLEVPAKNHAMIQLARKLQYTFSGLCDNYYANRDIAFFFVNILR